ncbi:MAG: head decoration protein [Pseudomonadota bacterium]
MGTEFIEGPVLGDLLKWEQGGRFSREAVTVLGGSGAERVLALGAVVGQITATEKIVALDPAASDGSEVASGVMIGKVTAPDAVDMPGVAVVRDAIVMPSALVWPDGITELQKEAALDQLKAKGIITRKEV